MKVSLFYHICEWFAHVCKEISRTDLTLVLSRADIGWCYVVHSKAPWKCFEISCLLEKSLSNRQKWMTVLWCGKTLFPLWFQYICRTVYMSGRTLEFTQRIWNTIYWTPWVYCNLCGFRKIYICIDMTL